VQVSTSIADGDPAVRVAADAWTVDVVTDVEAFWRLKGEWNDAVDRAGATHPFLRHEWFRSWWEAFGAGRRLHVVVVRSGGRVAAIAPLLSETVWMYGVPVRQLRLMYNDHTPRADFIVAEQPERACRAIWSALTGAGARWDVLLLGQLPRESMTREMLSDLAGADGRPTGEWASSESPFLELTGSADAYFGRLPAKFRQNVRNRIARLRRIGEPRLEVLEGERAVDEGLKDAFRLEASGWKHGEGTSIASHAALQTFYTSFARRAAAAGWLRLLFLTIDGRRIATSYSLCYQQRLFLCKTGYDPEFETCSPFKVLTYFAIRHAYERGLVEVDFLGDSEPWKREWTATARPHDWLFVFANSSRAQLVYPLKFQVIPAFRSAKAFALHALRAHGAWHRAPGTQHEAPGT
jgi:CelD/BcsL family acetyltransferase involved in cellulose biosynthesis